MAYEDYLDEEDDEEQDEGPSEEELQEQINAQQKKQMQIEEKLLKNKLRATMTRLAGGAIALNMNEKATMKKAKKHEGLKKDIFAVNALLALNKTKLAIKTMSSSPAWYYIGIGALILLVIICVVCIVASIMPWLFPGDTGDLQSAFGVTGKDFYGARVVYKDDEKASINMIENYVEFVESGIDAAETIPNVTVNIDMPAEEYDYSTFEESEFQTAYPVLYTTIFDMAKVVYKADNSADFSGVNLIECANGILYFGFGEESISEVSDVVKNAILTNYSVGEEGGNPETQITSALNTLFADAKYTMRAEKLFVKDYIISGEDERISGMTKENYVAFIFMPKTNVTFTKFSFAAGGANLSDFTIEMVNNGDKITLNKDNSNFGDTGNGESSVDSFIYNSSLITNESANAFSDIDTNNLNALSGGLSLFDVVQSVEDYSIYLEQSTEEGEQVVLTIKLNGVVVKLSNKEAFNFVEFETTWQTAS